MVKMQGFQRRIGKGSLLVLMTLFFFLMGKSDLFAEGSISVIFNSELMVLDSPALAPIMEKGRVLLPLRAVSENMGYKVSWDFKKKIVVIKDEDNILEIPVEKLTYKRNGKEKKTDMAPKLKNGTVFVPIRMIAEEFGSQVEWNPKDKTVIIEKYRTVEAADAVALLKNIDHNTKIILTGKEYNLSNVVEISNPNIRKVSVFDGEEYVIVGVNNLTIEAKKGIEPLVVVKPRYANVLTFEGCYNLKLKGIKAGHTIESGYCTGGVFKFLSTVKASIEKSKLYGCGTHGILGEYSYQIDVKDTEIYDCTYGCVSLSDCNEVKFSSCVFRDSKEFSMFDFVNVRDVLIENSLIKNNVSAGNTPLISSSGASDVTFLNSKFIGNKYVILQSGDGIRLKDCYVED